VLCSSFKDLGIDEEFAELLKKLGYEKPTSIQCLAIPKILKSRSNIIVVSPTGTGKTEAVLIPVFYLLKKLCAKPIAVVYMTPLRALNRDIAQRISRLASVFGFDVELWHGDTPHYRRKAIKHNPPHILVTTPESLSIILSHRDMRAHLRNLSFVIVDEAQEVYESERGTELSILIARLMRIAKSKPRVMMISSPIHDAKELARFLTSDDNVDVVRGEHLKRYSVLVDTVDNRDEISSLSDALYCLPKLLHALKLLELGNKQAIVFVNTRIAAEELGHILSRKLKREYIAVHHGSLSKELRESVEELFRKGDLRYLVATSSLELGIDIGGIDLAIQIMSPRQAVRLIQRVGRAGHREEEISRGLVLVPPMISELIESAVIARRVTEGLLERRKLHTNALDVLAHQLIGLCIEGVCRVDELFKFFKRLRPYTNLSRELFDEVIKLLNEAKLVKVKNGEIEVTRAGEIYYKTTTMIVDTKKYLARSIIDRRVIASLDDEFIVTCREGDTIILGGKLWRITAIDYDREEIVLEPVELSTELKIPRWVGENIPVALDVAKECCALIEKLCTCKNNYCIENLLESYPLSQSAKKILIEKLRELCHVYPKEKSIVVEIVETSPQYILIYSCLGTKGSEALAILLSSLLKREYSIQVSYKAHQIATVIVPSRRLDRNEVVQVLSSLLKIETEQLKDILVQGLRESPLFKLYLVRVAKMFGLISKDVSLREVYRVAEAYRDLKPLVYEALREILIEKLDVDALIHFLNNLRNKRKIIVYTTSKPSPLAREILSFVTPLGAYDALPTHTIVDLVKKRLLSRVAYFLCLNCLNRWSQRLDYLLKKYLVEPKAVDLTSISISCPSCGSKLIAVFRNDEERSDAYRILLKARRGMKISPDDQKVLRRIKKCAEVIMNYGLAAAIAMQGIGIGPDTTLRIISRLLYRNSYVGLDELVKEVLNQERKFLSTHQYWH